MGREIDPGGLWYVHEEQPALSRERSQHVRGEVLLKLRARQSSDKHANRIIIGWLHGRLKQVGRPVMHGVINLTR